MDSSGMPRARGLPDGIQRRGVFTWAQRGSRCRPTRCCWRPTSRPRWCCSGRSTPRRWTASTRTRRSATRRSSGCSRRPQRCSPDHRRPRLLRSLASTDILVDVHRKMHDVLPPGLAILQGWVCHRLSGAFWEIAWKIAYFSFAEVFRNRTK